MANNTAAARITQETSAENDNDTVRHRNRPVDTLATDLVVWDNSAPARRDFLRKKRKPWPSRKVSDVATLYLSDIEKTIRGRHPGGRCNTDDGRAYFDPAVNLMAARFMAMKDQKRNPRPLDIYGWARKFTPLLVAEHPRAWFDDVERRIMAVFDDNARPPVLPDADEMAEMIGTTQADVEAFKLMSIRGIDVKAPQRLVNHKQKDAEGARRRREKKGATPRSQSMAAQKPWEAYDMKERTYRRRVAAGKLPPHPTQHKAKLAAG